MERPVCIYEMESSDSECLRRAFAASAKFNTKEFLLYWIFWIVDDEGLAEAVTLKEDSTHHYIKLKRSYRKEFPQCVHEIWKLLNQAGLNPIARTWFGKVVYYKIPK